MFMKYRYAIGITRALLGNIRSYEAFRKRNMKRSAINSSRAVEAHFMGRSPASFFMYESTLHSKTKNQVT